MKIDKKPVFLDLEMGYWVPIDKTIYTFVPVNYPGAEDHEGWCMKTTYKQYKESLPYQVGSSIRSRDRIV